MLNIYVFVIQVCTDSACQSMSFVSQPSSVLGASGFFSLDFRAKTSSKKLLSSSDYFFWLVNSSPLAYLTNLHCGLYIDLLFFTSL